MEPEETAIPVEVNIPPKAQNFVAFLVAAGVGFFVEEVVKKGVHAGFAALKNR